MLTASLVIDLSTPPTDNFSTTDRNKVFAADLDAAPDGTRVIVLVGSRRWAVDSCAVRMLHSHMERLNLDVRGHDGETIAVWHRAVRDGDLYLDVAV